jgi:hypothetical protein
MKADANFARVFVVNLSEPETLGREIKPKRSSMFCPKCSKPIADEVQFCQQCGFALEGVKRLLASGGSEREAIAVKEKARVLSPRRKGYRLGFKLVLLALLLLPFYPIAEHLFDSLIPSVENSMLDELPMEFFGAMLLVLFVGGLARIIYARMFESEEAAPASEVCEIEDAERPRLFSVFDVRQLPPSQSIPVEDFTARRVNTADLAKPRSVTEHTTSSLRLD